MRVILVQILFLLGEHYEEENDGHNYCIAKPKTAQ